MKIVIDSGFIFRDYESVEMDRYFTDCLTRLMRSNPQSKFWVLDSPFFRNKEWSGLPVQVIAYKNWLPGQWGENWLASQRLRSTIGKQAIDCLLSIGGSRLYAGRLSRFFWIPGQGAETFIRKNTGIFKELMLGRSFLITDSSATKSQLIRQFALPGENIFVVPLAFSENYNPLSWADKEHTKVKYAGGKEYFLTRANYAEKNLMSLLRAFSIFKKKQQSNMNLLIAGIAGEPDHTPYDKLVSYKYRHDVHAYAGLSEREFIKMSASAYALIQPVDQVLVPSLLNAFQAGVPVVSGAGGRLEQLLKEGVLAIDPENIENLAEGMITLFTNEGLRLELIRKGSIEAGRFNIQQSVASLWQALQAAEKR